MVFSLGLYSTKDIKEEAGEKASFLSSDTSPIFNIPMVLRLYRFLGVNLQVFILNKTGNLEATIVDYLIVGIRSTEKEATQ